MHCYWKNKIKTNLISHLGNITQSGILMNFDDSRACAVLTKQLHFAHMSINFPNLSLHRLLFNHFLDKTLKTHCNKKKLQTKSYGIISNIKKIYNSKPLIIKCYKWKITLNSKLNSNFKFVCKIFYSSFSN